MVGRDSGVGTEKYKNQDQKSSEGSSSESVNALLESFQKYLG
jgi:hypothetical protein